MTELILHPVTAHAVKDYIENPAHALLITGAPGSGKTFLAAYIVSRVLRLDPSNNSAYKSHPYVRLVRPDDGKTIPVETIRSLQKFLSLKVPTTDKDNIARAIIIEDAHLLSLESQNALLKTLEEPPADTILMLLIPSAEAVLATIQSRSRQLAVRPPGVDRLTAYFSSQQYDAENINRALMLSGELPGLATALLTGDTSHPLMTATTHARGILRSKTYERLLLVDSLSKQKALCIDILFVLTQMARMSLVRSIDDVSGKRWHRVLQAAYTAAEQLSHNTQTKLVLTNLMLEL